MQNIIIREAIPTDAAACMKHSRRVALKLITFPLEQMDFLYRSKARRNI